ncbi:MAG: tetratricopeptide (TPR) repeat protein/tRNA A-37 threonylcarbamoyl transferase component Bud32, partial [Pirellulaceae bacterium]
DEHLLFAVIAMQLGHIDAAQFGDICARWGGNKEKPLDQIMVEAEMITEDERAEIARIWQLKIDQHEGNGRAALNSAADTNIRESLDDVGDNVFDVTSHPPSSDRITALETIDWAEESRSRYTLTRVHGEGGLGRVWLAIDAHLKREVALKELRPNRNDEQNSLRLIREAQITGQLDHPNIVPVYELAPNGKGDRPFYTMRFLRGVTFGEKVRSYHTRRKEGKATRMELRELVNAFVNVCNAIGYAHSRGIVHRDLKPSNIMVGDYGEVVVLDWGLAKNVEDPDPDIDIREIVTDSNDISKTIEGQVIGTPAYMSPEQADGRLSLIDRRTDIYGLGAILFMILVGRPPHRGQTTGNSTRDTMDLLRRITEGDVPTASEADASAPKPLSAIARKAMAKSRKDRYDDTEQLAEDVSHWLADEPVEPYADAVGERVARWMRRNKTWTQAGAAALVLVAAVSLVSALLVNLARQKTETALAAEKVALGRAGESLKSAKAARELAHQRFLDARRTVDESVTGLSEVLRFYPNTQPLREELLTRAAREYEKFAKVHSDAPEIQLEVARAHIRLADIQRQLQQYETAIASYRLAETHLAIALKSGIKRSEIQFEAAQMDNKLAILYEETGKNDEAKEATERALKTLDSLSKEYPDNPQFDYVAAGIRMNQANLLRINGLYEKASLHLETAETTFTKLAADGNDQKYYSALASCRLAIAQLLNDKGQSKQAVDKANQAINAFQQLLIEQKNHPPYLEALANSRIVLANSLRTLGKDKQMIQAYEDSIRDFGDLLDVRPGVPMYVESISVSRTNLSQVLHRIGKCPEAKEHCLVAIETFISLVDIHPKVLRYREEKASCFATLGMILRDLDENELALTALNGAVSGLEQLTAEYPDVPTFQRRLAVSLTSLGRLHSKLNQRTEARQKLARSVATLQQLLQTDQDDIYARDALAWAYTRQGEFFLLIEEQEDAEKSLQAAIDLRRTLKSNPEHLAAFAELLGTCPAEMLRDYDVAVTMINAAISSSPLESRYHHIAALIYLENENYEEAKTAIDRCLLYRIEERAEDWFVLAILHHLRDDTAAAAMAFDKGLDLLSKKTPGRIEAIRLRDRAAPLIGIKEPAVDKTP